MPPGRSERQRRGTGSPRRRREVRESFTLLELPHGLTKHSQGRTLALLTVKASMKAASSTEMSKMDSVSDVCSSLTRSLNEQRSLMAVPVFVKPSRFLRWQCMFL
ncbi:uncharacterized protein LOC120653893 [Panicum virgatum]|uniref:uncharacterized protein LOC120653893 n=1 Tax=Panicum virgatum TaxID=38727 RepID=UPI0019D5F857|nr:uncharacterized protein LOC120653893 [Panicum virgatum]